jgi:CheY-like chemotaxis protein
MGGTLLLADDSITIQKVVELTFAETEHSVVAVGNGRDLLARIDQVRPDVILCDVVMPDLNGYDICQRIKSEPATLHIPVVLLTGTFEPFDRDRALAAGCDAIVTKPFEAKELIATVEDLLMRSQALADGGGAEGGGAAGEYSVPEGVQGIDFTTTGFERMVAQPPKPELPPVDGVEMTMSSFQSQISAPAPPPPPELADDSNADLGRRSSAARHEPEGGGIEELLPAVPEDQTTPSGQAPSPEERKAAALALLVEVGSRAASATGAPAGGFDFGDTDEGAMAPAQPPSPAPVPVPAPAPHAVAPPVSLLEPVVAPPAPAPATFAAAPSAPRELSQDEVDRIARRVLELAEPLIERIAWEVIPDMAEMMVRQRIRELEEAAEEES